MRTHHHAWNKGRLLGQKPPLKPKEIWSIRIRLQLADRARDQLGFGQQATWMRFHRSKGARRLPRWHRRFACHRHATEDARPVQFEITEPTREVLAACVLRRQLRPGDYRERGPGPSPVRHAFAPAHQGDSHLQAYEEHSGDSVAPGAFETGEHRPVPGRVSRRRARDL
jgi:hypothetical protein